MSLIEEISQKYKISPELAKVLVEKGVRNLDLAEATFNPVLDNLQPPSTLPDLIPAVERILKAVGKGESILIFGHEDADGITSTAIMIKTLKVLGSNPYHYIPSKKNEAYGLTKSAIDYIKGKYNPTLLITVDSCTSCFEGVEYCKEQGIDVIVTDHHEVKESLPKALVVNPKIGGDSFPYLAGCGVAFKVAWELLSLKFGWDLDRIKEEIPELFIFAAIGTLADRVPLFCENRIFYEEGKRAYEWYRMNFVKAFEEIRRQNGYSNERPTIEELIPIVSSGKSVNGENAGVQLLLSEDVASAEEILRPLWEASTNWQSKAQAYLEKAKSLIKVVRDYIAIDLKDAEPQYIGYVASQLKDAFNVPVIVMGRREDGIVVAEVRVPYGFNSLDMLNYLSDLFIDYGGHKPASGFSMYERDIPELFEQIENYFKLHPFENVDLFYDISYNRVEDSKLEELHRLGSVGVEVRALFNSVKIGELRESVKKYPVIDPENLLDLYYDDVEVKVLLVTSSNGFRVDKLVRA
ncbi:MAG: DHH family phosphoesterase [bacterium]|nr:DHH family phosphoesterase [bacterium]